MSRLLAVVKQLDTAWPNVLRILLYHRIADHRIPHLGDSNLISATPDDFDTQMEYVARHYTPVTAEHVIEVIRRRATLPPRAVLVTFDDGYRDFLLHAWPILRGHGVPAVLFVPSAFPDSGRHFWWDIVHDAITHTTRPRITLPQVGTLPLQTRGQRWLAVRRLISYLKRLRPDKVERAVEYLQGELGSAPLGPAPILTWDELRYLQREGLVVAPHTRTHPMLPTLTQVEITEEIKGACGDLLRELGKVSPLFSYPFGPCDSRALAPLHAEGIVAAFTAFCSTPVLNILGRTNPLLLRRESISGSRSFTEFCLSLTATYSVIQSESGAEPGSAKGGARRSWSGHDGQCFGSGYSSH